MGLGQGYRRLGCHAAAGGAYGSGTRIVGGRALARVPVLLSPFLPPPAAPHAPAPPAPLPVAAEPAPALPLPLALPSPQRRKAAPAAAVWGNRRKTH